MPTLVTALYAEGRSDERFLPIIIQRTAVRLLCEHAHQPVDVLEPQLLYSVDAGARREERILDIARQAHGHHLLFVHADADDATPARARQERIRPGFEAVARSRQAGAAVCAVLLPVVPVQMTEAWMLADGATLRDLIGAGTCVLDLPARPALVEHIADPKARLRQALAAVAAARPRRRRREHQLADLYEPLARQIDLARLRLTPSFAQFWDDLHTALRQTGYIRG